MEDRAIIELFWQRDERAIGETDRKYGRLCLQVAANLLDSREDCEECVNDTYMGLWKSIPDQRPNCFSAFVTKITRNLALKKYEYNTAAKRNAQGVAAFEELECCVSGGEYVENAIENRHIEGAINGYLATLSREKRTVFLGRYWYFEPIETISARTGFSQSKVKAMLYRMRKELRGYLEQEGISV